MSEKSEKTYISIHEFISSWEKEIYELTNLDYFAYHLINFLGNQIETVYFNKKEQTGYLQLDSEDIGTLAFNIGDSFAFYILLSPTLSWKSVIRAVRASRLCVKLCGEDNSAGYVSGDNLGKVYSKQDVC